MFSAANPLLHWVSPYTPGRSQITPFSLKINICGSPESKVLCDLDKEREKEAA